MPRTRRLARTLGVLALVLLCCAAAARADGEGPSWSDLQKQCRKAFKAVPLPSHGELVKEITPSLPEGVVIEAAPFDALIQRLVAPRAEQLALRQAALRGLAQHPSPATGKLLEAAYKTLAKEGADRAKRLAATEAEYADVYNAGYMESSEGARRTRKLAAVLIPFYRMLLERNRELRALAVDVLASMRTEAAATWLRAAARGASEPLLREAALRALGRIGGDEARLLLEQAAAKDADPQVRGGALAALAAWPLQDMRAAVLAALDDPAWEVRALAVTMCARGGLVDAVGALIARLAQEDGRLRDDIDDALYAIVGVRMYADVGLWTKWLAENAESLAEKERALVSSGAYAKPLGPPESWPTGEPGESAKDEKRGGTAAFYGITSRSKRIVFLVDISRSMQDEAQDTPPKVGDPKQPYREPQGPSKMAIARWQLHRVVHDLPEDACFNIIVYSESYALWEEQMTRAKPRAKKAAHAFIDGLVANGTTNIGDSLDKALDLAAAGEGGLAVDTLFLLSDGNPNRGRINVLADILEDFVARNHELRLVVHTIGIGEAAGSSFLESLAARTGGRYVGFR